MTNLKTEFNALGKLLGFALQVTAGLAVFYWLTVALYALGGN